MDNPIQKIDASKMAANNQPTTDTQKKMDVKKVDDATHSNPQDNLQPEKVKIAGQTLTRGDELHAKKIVQDARASGTVLDTNGQKVDVNSPAGKGLIAQIQALGEGNTARGAEKIGKMQASISQNIAKGQAIAKARGIMPNPSKTMSPPAKVPTGAGSR